jgi:hypothetical protein
MQKILNELMQDLSIDERRTRTAFNPFNWSVRSEDHREICTWTYTFGVDEIIAKQIDEGLAKYTGAGVATFATVAMRRFGAEGHWGIIAFGLCGDRKGITEHGVLAVCKNGDEEKIGDELLIEVNREVNADCGLWQLKYNQPLVRVGVGGEIPTEYKTVSVPASEP